MMNWNEIKRKTDFINLTVNQSDVETIDDEPDDNDIGVEIISDEEDDEEEETNNVVDEVFKSYNQKREEHRLWICAQDALIKHNNIRQVVRSARNSRLAQTRYNSFLLSFFEQSQFFNDDHGYNVEMIFERERDLSQSLKEQLFRIKQYNGADIINKEEQKEIYEILSFALNASLDLSEFDFGDDSASVYQLIDFAFTIKNTVNLGYLNENDLKNENIGHVIKKFLEIQSSCVRYMNCITSISHAIISCGVYKKDLKNDDEESALYDARKALKIIRNLQKDSGLKKAAKMFKKHIVISFF